MAPDFSQITVDRTATGFDDPANPTSFTATIENGTENYISFAFAPTFNGNVRGEYQSSAVVIDPNSTGEVTTNWPESENTNKDDITAAVFLANYWDGSSYNDISPTDLTIPLQFRAPFNNYSINECTLAPEQVSPGGEFTLSVGVNNETGSDDVGVFAVDVRTQLFIESGVIQPNADTTLDFTYSVPSSETGGNTISTSVELLWTELDFQP